MRKEDKKLQKHLVDEMMKVSETNPDVMLYMQALMENYEKLEQENKQLKDLYRKTCDHLFNIGNDELARYFQAQINECSTFTTQILGDKENE